MSPIGQKQTLHMTFQGWDYSYLLPCLVILLVCVCCWSFFGAESGTAVAIGAVAWMAGTALTLMTLGFVPTKAIWHRDLAFAAGLAVSTVIPFALAGLTYYGLSTLRLKNRTRCAVAFACGATTLILVPPLMFGAAITACVLSGYSSCM